MPELILPKGVTAFVDDVDQLTTEIVIRKYVTRKINVPTSFISIYGSDVSGDTGYAIADDPLVLSIKGKSEIVNNIDVNDIILSINVNDLEPGQHEVPLTANLPGDAQLVGEYSVIVIIESLPTGGSNIKDIP